MWPSVHFVPIGHILTQLTTIHLPGPAARFYDPEVRIHAEMWLVWVLSTTLAPFRGKHAVVGLARHVLVGWLCRESEGKVQLQLQWIQEGATSVRTPFIGSIAMHETLLLLRMEPRVGAINLFNQFGSHARTVH